MNGAPRDAAEPAPVWERPWSLEEIRKGSQSWSLASDAGVSGAAGVGPEPGTGGVRGPPLGPGGRVRGGAAARRPERRPGVGVPPRGGRWGSGPWGPTGQNAGRAAPVRARRSAESPVGLILREN